MDFSQSTKNYFHKWNDFRTRIPRSEYWFGYLGVMLISIGIGILLGSIAAVLGASPEVINLLFLPWQIFTFVATLALAARRLHDLNMSGWWQLIALTGIGIIPLLIWLCSKGTDESNRFGPNPLTSDIESMGV